jgi:hypothetical protein
LVEAASIIPGARVHPPVRHGDVLSIDAAAGDTVVIIDGAFFHAAAVRHKEILELLARGVRVVGAASMGALRAAELWRYGMIGVGDIFSKYAGGAISQRLPAVVRSIGRYARRGRQGRR